MFIKSWFLKLVLLFPVFLFSGVDLSLPSIVFIHIGKELPDYLETAVKQARLFNRCNIVVVGNASALSPKQWIFEEYGAHCVFCESLHRTGDHAAFLRYSPLDAKISNGFWRNTSERFFYLQEVMNDLNLSDVVHLENDNMLYVDVESLIPIFRDHYPPIAMVLDNDERCVPSFVYVADASAMNHLARFMGDAAPAGKTDMEILACYFKAFGRSYSDQLPIIMGAYVSEQPLRSQMGHLAKDCLSYCKHEDLFLSLFDGAAFGQYLGGLDPRYFDPQPGYVSERCLFNSSLLSYRWKVDAEGRKVPYAAYKDCEYRINNLHIHSKNLEQFSS